MWGRRTGDGRRRVCAATGKAVPPGRTLAHLNIASLTRRGINTQTLGAILGAASPPRRILICGNADTDTMYSGRARCLLWTRQERSRRCGADPAIRHDAQPFGLADDVVTLARYAATTDADVFVAVLGDPGALRPCVCVLLLPHTRRRDETPCTTQTLFSSSCLPCSIWTPRRWMFCSYRRVLPPRRPSHSLPLPSPLSSCRYVFVSRRGKRPAPPETWTQLTPILALGPDFAPGLLSSPTTRTPGLVANVDIAPTLLRALLA